jgi:hypothetical protein
VIPVALIVQPGARQRQTRASKMINTPMTPFVQAPASGCVEPQPITTTAVGHYAPGPLSAPGLEVLEELKPDFSMAQDFLLAMDPNANEFCFQVFDVRGQIASLSRTLHGPFDKKKQQLAQLNRRGCGVFVTPNVIAPGMRRLTKNVTRVRAFFVDADDPDRLPELEAAIQSIRGLRPSIVVESSPGKRHFYWLCDNCPLDQFSDAQKTLADVLGTDPSVHDLPRVMRLPGFIHRKGAPFMTRLIRVS